MNRRSAFAGTLGSGKEPVPASECRRVALPRRIFKIILVRLFAFTGGVEHGERRSEVRSVGSGLYYHEISKTTPAVLAAHAQSLAIIVGVDQICHTIFKVCDWRRENEEHD